MDFYPDSCYRFFYGYSKDFYESAAIENFWDLAWWIICLFICSTSVGKAILFELDSIS